jgi:hypothetical protein
MCTHTHTHTHTHDATVAKATVRRQHGDKREYGNGRNSQMARQTAAQTT